MEKQKNPLFSGTFTRENDAILSNDELWCPNFRVTKETFAFILAKIEQDIHHKNTQLREAVSAKRRLAVTLYFLACTAEYRTIGNLFGVSRSFVSEWIHEVCYAVAMGFPWEMIFYKSFEVMKMHGAF